MSALTTSLDVESRMFEQTDASPRFSTNQYRPELFAVKLELDNR